MTVLEGLIQLGFEPITEWIIKGSKIGPLGLDWEDHGGWLYAFVVDGEVKYIGLTDRVLRSRMGDYSHIKNTQTTGLREKIMTELSVAAGSTFLVGDNPTSQFLSQRNCGLGPNIGHHGTGFNDVDRRCSGYELVSVIF